MKICQVGADADGQTDRTDRWTDRQTDRTDRRTGGRTDRYEEANTRFLQFCGRTLIPRS
jgi:hypothetical protein